MAAWVGLNAGPVQSSSGVLVPRFLKNESFVQLYTFTALFSDSSLIQIQFALTNLGIGDHNAACKILLVSGARKPRVWNKKYGTDKWRYTAEPDTQVLKIGPNEISVHQGETRAVAGDSKMRAKVTLPSAPDVVVPPDARISAKNRFFEYAVAVRWMPAQVTLTRGGAPPEKLRGYGMLEVSRSTSFPSDICRGWVTFRGYDADAAFNANIRLPPGTDAPSVGWVWEASDTAPASIKDLLLEVQVPKGIRRKPALRKVAAPDGSFTIEPQALLCRYSFIDELGPILGAIVRLVVGAPVVYFYRATVQLPESAVAVPGILEYMRIE